MQYFFQYGRHNGAEPASVWHSYCKTPFHFNNINVKHQMKEFFEHIKKIAIADSRLYFEPYMMMGRFIRRLFRAIFSILKRSRTNYTEGDGQ
jgi:hypothetical protein